jgi:hypothetical protein
LNAIPLFINLITIPSLPDVEKSLSGYISNSFSTFSSRITGNTNTAIAKMPAIILIDQFVVLIFD